MMYSQLFGHYPTRVEPYLYDIEVSEGKNRKGGTGYLMTQAKRNANRKKRK